MKLYWYPLSGHSHRVELFLNLTGQDFERIEVDLMKGEHKTEGFLSLNPFGQVPVLVDGHTVLGDSNAILTYLAKEYAPEWFPEQSVESALVQRWLSVAAGELAGGPGAARLVTVFGAGFDHGAVKAKAHKLFATLDKHLESRPFLVGDKPTIADVAIYSYTAHAPEGGVSLESYPNIRAWLSRIEELPGFVGMRRSNVELVS